MFKAVNKTGVGLAITIFLIVIASTIWLLFQKPDANELYKVFYQPYPAVIETINVNTNKIDTLYQFAFEMYESANYEKAALIFNKITSISNSSSAMLYFGICNLELGKTSIAIDAFKNLIKQNNDYQTIAEWYLAMAYLKNDEAILALPLVEEVATSKDHPIQPIAEKLLSKLQVYK